MSRQAPQRNSGVRHLLAILLAYAALISLAGAMLNVTDHDPGSDFDVSGLVVVMVSVISIFVAHQYSFISIFTGILLISTVLIVKRGFEGLGVLRIALIGCGGFLTVFFGLVTDTQLASGYWYWLASFILSLSAHLLSYRQGGTLDATYTFYDEEH